MQATNKTQILAQILINTFEHHRQEAAKMNAKEGQYKFNVRVAALNLIIIQLPDLSHLLSNNYLDCIFRMTHDMIIDVGDAIVETVEIHLYAHDGTYREGRHIYAKHVN